MATQRRYSTNVSDDNVLRKELTDGRAIEMNFAELPEVSQKHIIAYGMTQMLNDCHSGEKELDEIFRLSNLKVEDLMKGQIRRRSGLGLGVDFDLLVKAVAAVSPQLAGDEARAKEVLSQYVPTEDDDEDTIKEKKSKIRTIANQGAVKAKLDELRGKSVDDVLSF